AAMPEGMMELVAVSRHPSDGVWWRPDGTPSSEGPFEDQSSVLELNPGQRAYKFVFRSRDLEQDDSSRTYEIEGASGWSGGPAPKLNGRTFRGGSAVTALFP